jgi:hypothetical protein
MIPTLAILLSLAITWDIAHTLLRSWRPWPEPRAHHRFRCGGSCDYSCDSSEVFALHVESQHRAVEGVDYLDGWVS